jgi:hypothetical protein
VIWNDSLDKGAAWPRSTESGVMQSGAMSGFAMMK